jgi:hypothetical protein
MLVNKTPKPKRRKGRNKASFYFNERFETLRLMFESEKGKILSCRRQESG